MKLQAAISQLSHILSSIDGIFRPVDSFSSPDINSKDSERLKTQLLQDDSTSSYKGLKTSAHSERCTQSVMKPKNIDYECRTEDPRTKLDEKCVDYIEKSGTTSPEASSDKDQPQGKNGQPSITKTEIQHYNSEEETDFNRIGAPARILGEHHSTESFDLGSENRNGTK